MQQINNTNPNMILGIRIMANFYGDRKSGVTPLSGGLSTPLEGVCILEFNNAKEPKKFAFFNLFMISFLNYYLLLFPMLLTMPLKLSRLVKLS